MIRLLSIEIWIQTEMRIFLELAERESFEFSLKGKKWTEELTTNKFGMQGNTPHSFCYDHQSVTKAKALDRVATNDN